MNHSRSAINIALIVAMSEDGTIGDKGKVPWHISADLRRFKRLSATTAGGTPAPRFAQIIC